MCDVDWDEPASVWTETVQIARKDHRCHMCRGTIKKGAPYTKVSMVYAGTAATEKMCGACSLVSEAFAKEHRSAGMPSIMRETLIGCVDQGGGRRWDEDRDVELPAIDRGARKWQAALRAMDRRHDRH